MSKETAALRFMLGFLLCQAAVARAVEPSFRHFDDLEYLKQGEIRGVSISERGVFAVGPRVRLLWEAQAPFVWDVAVSPKGDLYFAAGASGAVYHYDRNGKVETVFESQEVLVTALAATAAGELYFGTTPDACIYRVAPGKGVVPVCDLPDTYVWKLRPGPDGSMWIATGQRARLYRLGSSGKLDTILTSEESHIRSLIWGPRRAWLLGTAENGYVYRATLDGQVFTLWDSPLDEVVSLAPRGEDALLVASLQQVSPAGEEGQATTAEMAGRILGPGRGLKQKSVVHLVETTGSARELWNSTDELVLAVTPWKDVYLLASGPQGRIYSWGPNGELALLASVGPCHILSVIPVESRLLAATANPGKVFELQCQPEGKGEYTSPVFDARLISRWGQVQWREEGKGRARLFTRSGNTEKPNSTWSSWAPVTEQGGARGIQSPPARFLQWKLEMEGDSTYRVEDICISYVQMNSPPVLKAIRIYAPNQAYSGAAKVENYQRAGQGEGLSSPKSLGERKTQMGFRTCSWEFEDPNGDKLAFRLEIRREDWREWKVLGDQMAESAFALDTQTLPDGFYRFRVTASDAPSNPINQARTASLESEPFLVDHTPPSIQALRCEPGGSRLRLSFQVEDKLSRIQSVEVSIGAGPWVKMASDDGVVDSRYESFHLELPLPGSSAVVSVRASDEFGNMSFAWVSVP
jgi:hypothetical protein